MKSIFYLSICTLCFCSLTFCGFKPYKYKKGNGNIIERKVSLEAFDRLYVGGSFNVTLHHSESKSYTLVITDENLQEFIKTEQNGATVKLSMKGNLKTTKLDIHVYSPHYKSIEAHGSGDVLSEDLITEEEFNLASHGSGNVNLRVEAQKAHTSFHGSGGANIGMQTSTLRINLHGSGDVQFVGESGKTHITLNGSGSVKAKNLVVAECEAKINGSGNISIHVTEAISSHINGSGNVRYKGFPHEVNSSVNGSGNVKNIAQKEEYNEAI